MILSSMIALFYFTNFWTFAFLDIYKHLSRKNIAEIENNNTSSKEREKKQEPENK